MKIPSNTFKNYTQGFFVVLLQVVIFLTTFFVATTTFAQEISLSEETSVSESKEVQSIESTEEQTSLQQEFVVQEPELSKEQQREIAELDRLLKSEKISQEEYDQRRQEIIGTELLATEQLSLARSSEQVEPDSQTLGGFVAPSVSTSNGSLNYEYPIALPQGRNGLTPEIVVVYNSSNKLQSSVIGKGWLLDIPFIQRINKKGTDTLYTDNYFTSSFDGELVSQGGGVYTPRIENGSFLKYEYSGNVWTITDKEGTSYEFGLTASARQDNSVNTSEIFTWMLEKVTDTNGNVIDYTYFKDGGQIYPETVTYAGGLYKVNFNRTTRTNPYTIYTPSFEVESLYWINQIEVLTDNSVTSTYDFTHSNESISDITLTGSEGSTSLSLPPLDLEYTHDNPNINEDFLENLPYEVDHDWSNATRFGDLNGDGLTDYIRSYRQNGYIQKQTYLNTGSGWQTSPDWNLPLTNMTFREIGNGNRVFEIYLIDIDGDGLDDLVDTSPNGINGKKDRYLAKVYLNTGSSFVRDMDYTFRHYVAGSVKFADLNGDRLPDYIRSYKRNNNISNEVAINTGTGWQKTTTNWQLPSSMFFKEYGGSHEIRDVNLVDINADGLADLADLTGNPIANGSSANAKIYINNGESFVLDNNYSYDHEMEYANRFADINGDGLLDAITSFFNNNSSQWVKAVRINTGNGWQLNTSWQLPANFEFREYGSGQNKGFDKHLIDIDGDGLPDAIDLHSSNNNGKVFLNRSEPLALEVITSSEGGTTEFTYSTAQVEDTSNKVPFTVPVVTSITTDDLEGNIATTNYSYIDADYYYGDPHDRRFAGFGSVITTHPDGSVETSKLHQGNGQQGNEPTDSYAKIGKVYETSVADGVGNNYEIIRTNYEENNLGGISNSIQTESVLTLQYDGTSSHTDTAVGYDYDSYGNVTKETQYGEVSGNTDGTFTDIGSDKRTTDITYTNNTTDYIVGLPTNQTLKNNSGVKEAETDFSYDTDGNLLTQSQWISGSNYTDTTYTYNSYGLPLTETDPLNNTNTYVYDSHTMYPATTTNAENHITSYTYDYSSGKVASMTEPNGKVIQYDYDALDRLVEEEQTFENGSTQTTRAISYNTSAQPQYRKETLYRSSSDSQDIYTYLDGFGKTIQTKQEMDSGWLTLDTVYENMDRVEKQSLPYETSSSSNSGATSNSNLMTSFVYDPLGRVTLSTNAKGTTTTDYNGFETTVTDAENNEKDLITDAFKNLVQVNEYNGSSTYTTEYDYNAQNLLTKITDAENNVRNIAYDGLGRRTSLEDLHDASDSTFGTWSFVYDDINLTSQTDPKGTTTSYTYDDINRVLTEDNSSTVGTDIIYSYDSCTFGSGKLCSVTTPNVTTSYTYLKQGLADTVTKLIDGVNYVTNNDYNRQGQTTKVTHPNSSYTEYEYNTRGLVDNILYNGTSLVTADYGVHGRPTNFSHSNGATSTLTYDANELYELTGKTTTSAGVDIQDLSYSYDDVGNITQIVDASATDTAKTQTFTYDNLYRLTQSVVTNSANNADYTRNYTYSPIGNITAFNGVTYTYTDNGYNNPHAVTGVGANTYTYNNNGNLTSDGTWTHTWDYRNRLSSSTDGLSTSSYEYDHENMRTKLVEGSDTTIYPSTDYELLNGNAKVSLSLGETLVATDDNGIINHVHTDHLGGTNITTDTLGAITQTLDYFPFGDTRIDTGTDNETKQFTGYTKDASTGLHYAGARYYANDIGRFISQDPVALALGDWNMIQEKTKGDVKTYLSSPQKHNIYSYAFNNPVKYEDDNGEFALLTQYASIASYKSTTEYAGGILHQNGYGAAASQLSSENSNWDFAISRPEVSGFFGVGGASAAAASTGLTGIKAFGKAAALANSGASLSQVAGQAAYGSFAIHSATQIIPKAGDLLSSLSNLENGQKGAGANVLKDSALLFGTSALPHNVQSAWEISSTTFETLDSIFPKKETNKKTDENQTRKRKKKDK